MLRLATLALCATGWISAQAPVVAPAGTSAFDGIDEAIAQLSKITGLESLRKVEHATITREGVRQFLKDRIKEDLKAEDIRLEELALKRFGLVPADYDLERATVDLITEQAAAFYDYRKKKLFLLEGDQPSVPGTGPEFGRTAQRTVLVHELAHALADQHFDLGKFLRKGKNDDSATARLAVMEGQATWLMLESMAEGAGQSMRTMPSMVELMGASAAESMASQYPVLASAPLYMRATLIFPYNAGLKFQHALVQKLGNQAFSRVFQQPPVSTQQILHPEKYFAGIAPVKVEVPNVLDQKNWKTRLDGTVGELEHAVLIEQYLSKKDAESLAPHWRGSRLGLIENKSSKKVALVYASVWENAGSARRMFDAYRTVLKSKWKVFKVLAESENSFSGLGDDGAFAVRLDGMRLTSVEGADAKIIG